MSCNNTIIILGYDSIIIISGDITEWKVSNKLQFILKEIVTFNATVVFVPGPSK